MNLTRTREGWKIQTEGTLSDEAAQALVFRAEPRQVVLGDFVEVIDAGGTRIGHLSEATYVERLDGPAFVVCKITLR